MMRVLAGSAGKGTTLPAIPVFEPSLQLLDKDNDA
ncbi:Uncharacterised protein [Aeromonas encheleia]|nr:Uncharacterised protein [Aeromonas encheleia]